MSVQTWISFTQVHKSDTLKFQITPNPFEPSHSFYRKKKKKKEKRKKKKKAELQQSLKTPPYAPSFSVSFISGPFCVIVLM